jgi:hypothetical protein
MFFTRNLSVAAPKASRSRAEGRSPRRRAAAFNLETLETRDLKSVTLNYGTLGIQGDLSSHNRTTISLKDGTLEVRHNDLTYTFSASEVQGINYVGAWGGNDWFVNDTNIGSTVTAMGGNNHIEGGDSYNFVYLVGEGNFYDSGGGASYVFQYGGGNRIVDYSNTYAWSF